MLLNWHTIDACFLSSFFHIRSSFTFFLACLGAFLLVISLEFVRRIQREADRRLRRRIALLQPKEYVLPSDLQQKNLDKENGDDIGSEIQQKPIEMVLEQVLRGLIHVAQFSISYCIMLMFMYSNGAFPCLILWVEIFEILMLHRIYHYLHNSWCFGRICTFHSGYPLLGEGSQVGFLLISCRFH